MGTIEALIPILVQLLAETPTLVSGVKQFIDLIHQTTPLTADQQAQIDAALEDAHNKLQAS